MATVAQFLYEKMRRKGLRMHCGFGYCSSCTDFQALIPRSGPSRGYDLAPVCAFCIDMLNVTTLSRSQLRSLPLAKLRRYISAYNIPVKNPIDKNDLVDAAMAARTLQGCLSPVNEDYYRKHSVPSLPTPEPTSTSSTSRNSSPRGFSSTNTNTSSRPNRPFPRPDLDPNRRRPQETTYSTQTPRNRTTSAPPNPGTTRPVGEEPNVSRPTSSSGRPSNPTTTHSSSHSHTAPPLPPPPMSTLVTLPRSSLAALSVGTLKQILFEARVRIPPGIVEKEELVDRVWALIDEEKRKDNEGIDDVGSAMEDDMEGPDREEEVVEGMVDPEWEVDPHATSVGAGDSEGNPFVSAMGSNIPSSRSHTPQPSTSPPNLSTSPSHSASRSKSRSRLEPSGLCVICQDEEANIAVVDCGHLAMCRECSELVLASSRECPLCRTRIVTEARLLRIFKT